MSRTVQLFIPRLRMTMKVNTGKAQRREVNHHLFLRSSAG